MHSSELLSRAWCDLVFEGRNKAYGAYQLRKQAGRRYRWALAVVAGCFALTILSGGAAALYTRYLLMRGMKEAENALNGVKYSELKEGYKVKFMATARLAPTERMNPGAVQGVPEIVEGEPPIQIMGIKGPISYDPEQDVITSPIIDTIGLKDPSLPIAKQKIVPTEVVSQIPEFPGGPRAFMKWLDAHIPYPPQMVSRGEQGNVTVCFIVDAEGYAQDFEIKDAFNRQVYRLISDALKQMPKWKPGTDENGQPTPVKVTVPIEFKI